MSTFNKHFWILCIVFLSIQLHAQDKNSIQPLPDWVKMIDNPNVNYYTAVNQFNEFWKDKAKPVEALDMDEEAQQEREAFRKYVSTLSTSERNYYDQLCYHYKRFKAWKKDIKPYVQEDGRILSDEERLAIWNKQQLEIKLQKK